MSLRSLQTQGAADNSEQEAADFITFQDHNQQPCKADCRQGGNGIFGSRHPQFRTTGPVPVPGKSLLAGLLKDLLTAGLLKTPWFTAGWPAEGCLPCGTRVDFVHICRNVTLGFRRQWLKVCTCGRSQFFPRSIFPARLAGWPPLFRLSIPPGSALVRQVKAENFRPGCGGVKPGLGSAQSVCLQWHWKLDLAASPQRRHQRQHHGNDPQADERRKGTKAQRNDQFDSQGRGALLRVPLGGAPQLR